MVAMVGLKIGMNDKGDNGWTGNWDMGEVEDD